MPLYEYRCSDRHVTEHLHNPTQAGGGRMIFTFKRNGERLVEGKLSATPPDHITCSICGERAKRVPSFTRAYLKADGTQTCGWGRPGMSGVDYSNGPDGAAATHLKHL